MNPNMYEVSIYISSYEQYCDEEPISREVALAILVHVENIINNQVSDTESSPISAVQQHETEITSGAHTIRCAFNSNEAAEIFFDDLEALLDGDCTSGIHTIKMGEGSCKGAANYNVEVQMGDRTFFGHILLRL